ncbi:unnamed protein product [Leptidea sinapis]|uniref:N-acetyltransferase domain-containing protein n=2 Tax=Leptidea sinapis TaxID=189913 RepID=A0A5E4R352_9NEOP|nr:unnamed protein product [Leptidea sinapis]
MEHKNLKVLRLHNHPEYLEACCVMINEEWPRSRTARMMSLKASCDKLPTSLILINDRLQLLGHAKLTPLPQFPNSCFIETVVIRKSMRGNKLGTFLMGQVEDYCKNLLNLEMVHLSTKGQEIFYAKLGYVTCAPVSIYGISVPVLKCEKKPLGFCKPPECNISSIPPPPPLPQPTETLNSTITSKKTFMFKKLK